MEVGAVLEGARWLSAAMMAPFTVDWAAAGLEGSWSEGASARAVDSACGLAAKWRGTVLGEPLPVSWDEADAVSTCVLRGVVAGL